MSSETTEIQSTQHAFLVAWGWFAQEIGLIQAIQGVSLHQKEYWHTPQRKVLEFLVAILAGLEHLQDISLAAHPLDRDEAVAQAWGQSGWADYSGVSRTLSGLTWDEARQLTQALEQVSQPFLQAELESARSQGKRLRLDGDLTGLPVSNTSHTYPNAAFGHMDDEIRLGYQAGVVSLQSETYGRLWLSVSHLPGNTVSCTQAEALVLAAEARLGLRPLRRTALLCQRLGLLLAQIAQCQQRLSSQQAEVCTSEQRLEERRQQVEINRQQLAQWEADYQARQRVERPTGQLAQARKRLQTAARRYQSQERACQRAKQRVTKTQAHCQHLQAEQQRLQERLTRFEQENASNPHPVKVEFRLDAGFATYENIALLIEMGYEVYTKAHSHKLVKALQAKTDVETAWQRVGANAVMVAWPNLSLQHCPYPLDVGLERFYTGQTMKQSALLHFGDDAVTTALPAWFGEYNGRQIVEAGIKESKQVFYLHRLKVRSEPAIYLQESLVIFAANFIRWARLAMSHPSAAAVTETTDTPLSVNKLGIKRQVRVGAHVSADVIYGPQGKWLRFSPQSVFAGKVLVFKGSPMPGRGLPQTVG